MSKDPESLGSSEVFRIDTWPWGREKIIWGYDPAHKYTLKILEPKLGRAGCLSLQYHNQKSESWVVIRGMAWALLAQDGVVSTRIMRPGDIQNIPAGVIHRLMACSSDLQVLEPSTPDRHAADKSVAKDIVRFHCVFGRPGASARDNAEQQLIDQCIKLTEVAMADIDRAAVPTEHNRPALEGAYNVGFPILMVQ